MIGTWYNDHVAFDVTMAKEYHLNENGTFRIVTACVYSYHDNAEGDDFTNVYEHDNVEHDSAFHTYQALTENPLS